MIKLPAKLLRRQDLTPAQKLIYGVLLEYGHTVPTTEAAEMIGVSRDTVIKGVARLMEVGMFDDGEAAGDEE